MFNHVNYISDLSDAQRQAVLAENNAVVILAGPGSGKTRTLIARVADLICRRSVNPSTITCITFTNKAATEMKNRLVAMLGPNINRQLNIGTFHAVCAKFLRAQGPKIGLASSFVIFDRSDSENYVKRALSVPRIKQQLETKDEERTPKPSVFLSFISKAKARNSSPDAESALLKSQQKKPSPHEDIRIVVYREYEKLLRENQALDFDDLLIFGLRLLQKSPKISFETQHVLVDEFQDTNTIQLEITKALCCANRRLTIVGDPDQSIYAWRSADVTNLDKIKAEFPDHQLVYLEENYRSTQHILTAAHQVISQDKTREQKSLFTNNPGGDPITIHAGETPEAEAAFIAKEIVRWITSTEGLVDYGDVAVLVRAAYLTRAVEGAFAHRRIPHILVGGTRFYDRAEIKDILAYLRLIANPNDRASFERAIGVPSRKIGEISVSKISLAAREDNTTPIDILRRLLNGQKVPNVKGIRREGIKEFLSVYDKLTNMLDEPHTTVQMLMQSLVSSIRFKEYLDHAYKKDADTRWENVEELLNSATRFHAVPVSNTDIDSELEGGVEEEAEVVHVKRSSRKRVQTPTKKQAVKIEFSEDEDSDEFVSPRTQNEQVDHDFSDNETDETGIHLRSTQLPNDTDLEYISPREQLAQYILSVSLASDVAETIDTKGNTNRKTNVTISTMHASKGLEWPIVFIAGSDQVPHPRSSSATERDEERRLMYVAMTRAQRLLYITNCLNRSNYMGITQCRQSLLLDCLFGSDGKSPKVIDNITTVCKKPPKALNIHTLEFFKQYRVTKPSSVTSEMAKQQMKKEQQQVKMEASCPSSSLQGYAIKKMDGFASASSLLATKRKLKHCSSVKDEPLGRSSPIQKNGLLNETWSGGPELVTLEGAAAAIVKENRAKKRKIKSM